MFNNATTVDIFGEKVNNHVWEHIGDSNVQNVAYIKDLIPLLEMEKELLEKKIELLKDMQDDEAMPLEDYKSHYNNNMRSAYEWMELVLKGNQSYFNDIKRKGYEIIPIHVTKEAIENRRKMMKI